MMFTECQVQIVKFTHKSCFIRGDEDEGAKNVLPRMVNANYLSAKDVLYGLNLELENISQENVIQMSMKRAVQVDQTIMKT